MFNSRLNLIFNNTINIRTSSNLLRTLSTTKSNLGSNSSRGSSPPLSSYLNTNTAPILIFHKSYCRVCQDLIERIEDGLSAGVMKEIAIDLSFSDRGDALREELRAKTGQKDVPFVFVGNHFMASVDVINGLRIKDGNNKDCSLKQTLENLKVQVKGPFRA
jgi:hypothetical protein